MVEGDAEEILIPLMVKKAIGISLDELGISLINIRSTGFENVAQLFHDKRIKRKCSILTDLDDAICDTSIKSDDTKRIKKYKKKVENSKKKGIERQKKLDKFSKDNLWIEPFYADHTFEVDFVNNGNAWEVEQLLDSVYTDKKTKDTAKDELNSSDVSLYGKRVLTMAKQEGKGWFAIMLGEHIDYFTNIPDYIIKAIVFAKTSFPTNLICNIIEYRIAKCFENDTKLDFSKLKQTLSDYKDGKEKLSQVINEIEKIIPDDQITNILKNF